jgi:hypothetical protein
MAPLAFGAAQTFVAIPQRGDEYEGSSAYRAAFPWPPMLALLPDCGMEMSNVRTRPETEEYKRLSEETLVFLRPNVLVGIDR